MTSSDIKAHYGFDAPCAILSKLGATVDPYRLASRILHKLSTQCVRIFDRTAVEHVTTSSRSISAHLQGGTHIKAGHVVVATGYAAQHWLRTPVAKNRSSYAFITDPTKPGELSEWSRTVLWETARPYLYAR